MADEQLGLDVIVRGMQQFQANLKAMDKSIDGIVKEWEGVGKASEQAAKKEKTAMQKIQEGFKKVKAVAKNVAAGVLAFGVTLKKAFDFGKQGAQILRLRDAGDQLADSLGGNMDRIVTSVRSASLGMVSDLDIIQASNRAMALGLGADAEQMGQLMQVAAFRARAMGLSTKQAFSDLSTGIGRVSPLILDNLGIVLDSKAIYGEWAAAHGRAVQSLTAVEKKQILMSSVIAEGNRQIEEAGGLAVDAAGKFEQFEASLANFTDNLKASLAPALSDAAEAANLLLFGGQLINTAFQEQAQRVEDTAGSWDEYTREMLKAAKAAGIIREGFEGQIDDQGRLIEIFDNGHTRYMQYVEDQQFMTRETFKTHKATQDFTQAIGFDAPAAVRKYVDAARDGVRATQDFTTAQDDIIMSLDDLKLAVSGPVGAANQKFIDQQREIEEEIEETRAEIAELTREQGFYAGSTEEITLAQFKASQAADKFTEAQRNLNENTDPEKVAELEAAVAKTSLALDGANQAAAGAAGTFVNNSEAIGELNGKLAEQEESLVTLREAYDREMSMIIFNMLQAKIAAGDFGDAGLELQVRMAENLGLIDEKTAETALAMDTALTQFAAGAGMESTLFKLDLVRQGADALDGRDIVFSISANVAQARAAVASITGGFGPPEGFVIPTGGPAVPGTKAETTESTPAGPPPQFPGFQRGAMRTRRGLAMLHENEIVVPMPQAERVRQMVTNNTTNTANTPITANVGGGIDLAAFGAVVEDAVASALSS